MGARFGSSLAVSTLLRLLSIMMGFLPHSGRVGRPDYQTLTTIARARLVPSQNNRTQDHG
jgi:hypothetical protein